MTEEINDLIRGVLLHLRMEDIVEERIQIDKKACNEVGRDWEELYEGRCETCGRAYEAAWLVTEGYSVDPYEQRPEVGDCIPCWRKKNDFPKINPGVPQESNP